VGGGGGGGSYCVDDDTPILLANGEEIAARFLKVGTMLRTRHETSLEWGDWPVTAIGFAYDPVWRAEIGGTAIRATRDHRFWIDGAWVRMGEIGRPDGKAWVARITVAGAHSYVSAGILSHNIKERMPDE
jgi:intein/homing endonuclease